MVSRTSLFSRAHVSSRFLPIRNGYETVAQPVMVYAVNITEVMSTSEYLDDSTSVIWWHGRKNDVGTSGFSAVADFWIHNSFKPGICWLWYTPRMAMSVLVALRATLVQPWLLTEYAAWAKILVSASSCWGQVKHVSSDTPSAVNITAGPGAKPRVVTVQSFGIKSTSFLGLLKELQ